MLIVIFKYLIINALNSVTYSKLYQYVVLKI